MDARDFAELVSAVLSCLRCLEQENGSGVAVRYRLVSFVSLHKTLRRGNQAIELTGHAKHRLDLDMLPRTPMTRKREVDPLGSFSGRVKELNIHKKMVFYLYPESGPRRVACHFPDKMIDQVTAAIGSHVTVHGAIEYDLTGTFPARIAVESVEIHDADRPRLRDLFGLVPDLTGGMESAAYIRAKRDVED